MVCRFLRDSWCCALGIHLDPLGQPGQRVLIQDCVNQGGITNPQITDDCHCHVCSESLGKTP